MSATPGTRIPVSTRSLLQLAWPVVLSRSIQAVIGMSDVLMVAHLGEAAVAATTTGATNAVCLFALPTGTVWIVGSFSSQFVGRGDPAGARRYVLYGLIVAVIWQFAGLAAIPFVDHLLGLFSLSPAVREGVRVYLVVRLLFAGASVGFEALASYHGGHGNTRLPMTATMIAGAANLAGNWLLINGNWGFPALGVAGAAWASALAILLAVLLLVAPLLREGGFGTALRSLRMVEFGRMLRFGIPFGINGFFEFFAFVFFFNVVVAGLGEVPHAAVMSAMQINSVSVMPAFGLAAAGAILVGQSIGAGAMEDVSRAVRLAFMLTAVWQFAVGLLYLLAPRLILSPLAQGDHPETFLDSGARVLMLAAAWQVFDSAAITLSEALRGAGDTVYTMRVRLVLSWLVLVPATYITVHELDLGEVVAMLWLVLYFGLVALLLYVRFRSGAWQKHELV